MKSKVELKIQDRSAPRSSGVVAGGGAGDRGPYKVSKGFLGTQFEDPWSSHLGLNCLSSTLSQVLKSLWVLFSWELFSSCEGDGPR